ncbi:hypothetical protein AMECASPLE_006537 [Ameca splendens]|uniref:Uncharacterized protein n=1 Tax=Ameca splendens TaxID=208324 RepID=A0ABV0XZC8_9TELE
MGANRVSARESDHHCSNHKKMDMACGIAVEYATHIQRIQSSSQLSLVLIPIPATCAACLSPTLYNNKNKGYSCHKMKHKIRFWPPLSEYWSPSGHPSEIFWLYLCM